MQPKLAIASVLLATGCAGLPASHQAEGVYKPITPTMTDPVLDGFATDAEEISALLRELTLLERSRQLVPQISKNPAAELSPSDPLAQKITFEWKGEATLVLRRVSEIAGWRFAVSNSAPLMKELRVKAVDVPLINVLEDLAVQLGNQADIRVDKSMKTIEMVVRG